jgi:prepilin-type processing-associated H-X9-DG protein
MRTGPQFSWIVLVLAQLEQTALHSQFDFQLTVFHQRNDPQAMFISTLVCPSDSARGRFLRDPDLTGGKSFAKGNYAAFVSPFHVENQWRFPGTLVANLRHTFADLKDGSSQTLMLGEVLTRANEQDQRGAWALGWTGTTQLAFDLHDLVDPIIYEHSGYVPNQLGLGVNQPPNNQGPNTDMLYKCPDPAGAQLENMPCNVWEAGTSRAYLSAAPRSRHTGGVQVAFADGHVGFLTNQIDFLTMAHLIHVSDGRAASWE